jgi:hypothetical protein
MVAVLADRDLLLVKKAPAIAARAIETRDGPFQSASDATDMKALLDRLVSSDGELAHYAHSARIAYTGNPEI